MVTIMVTKLELKKRQDTEHSTTFSFHPRWGMNGLYSKTQGSDRHVDMRWGRKVSNHRVANIGYCGRSHCSLYRPCLRRKDSHRIDTEKSGYACQRREGGGAMCCVIYNNERWKVRDTAIVAYKIGGSLYDRSVPWLLFRLLYLLDRR